jgi:16S rRNA G527 N7-methylase RsmG
MSTSVSFGEALRGALSGILEITDEQVGALERHFNLLVLWNRRLNLTTVTRLPAAAVRHYGESLFLASRLTDGSIVDVGSGPGFPGIPVAVYRPKSEVTLVESHRRKSVFLREATRGLPNVQIVCARAETLEGRYDWLISRAVDVRSLLRLSLARRYALLLGADDAAQAPDAEVFPLPWGQRRVLVVGRCSGLK